jgi:hypothetical protein
MAATDDVAYKGEQHFMAGPGAGAPPGSAGPRRLG